MPDESTAESLKPPNSQSAERVIAYVDGFNLYFGMREAQHRQYLWLDVHKLAKKLLGPQQALGVTKYFTARISGAKKGDSGKYAADKNAKRKRQTNYLDALASNPAIQIFEGNYFDKEVSCNGCGRKWHDQEEKMTDVSIATEMLCDAYDDHCDTLILVSGDSDLVPPIRRILNMSNPKRVIVAFPPCRYGAELAQIATGKRMIEKGHLKKCQLPHEVTLPNGHKLTKPSSWRQ